MSANYLVRRLLSTLLVIILSSVIVFAITNVLPGDAELQVRVGKRVKGGATVIARMADTPMPGGPPQRLRSASAAVEPENDGEPR